MADNNKEEVKEKVCLLKLFFSACFKVFYTRTELKCFHDFTLPFVI